MQKGQNRERKKLTVNLPTRQTASYRSTDKEWLLEEDRKRRREEGKQEKKKREMAVIDSRRGSTR